MNCLKSPLYIDRLFENVICNFDFRVHATEKLQNYKKKLKNRK
jgi:hypothetical protein